MFNVNFYNFSKRNNSTKIPNNSETSFDCDIRNVSNILNPQIELRHENPTNFNYCYIPNFSRYYFISNWTWNQGLWIASCNIDVLATYKTQIGSSTQNVVRSYSNKNEYLIDALGILSAQQTTNYYHLMPYPNQSGSGVPSLDKGVFVVGILGNNSGGQTMYELLPNQFQQFLSSLLTTADGYDWGDLVRGLKNSIMNPFQYITSCRWYPNEFIVSGTQELKCGLWGSNVNGYPIVNLNTTPYGSFFIPIAKHPQTSSKGKYINLAPFTKTILDCSVFGLINVDTSLLIDANFIGCKLYVDVFSGTGTIKGYATTNESFTNNDKLLFKKDVMFGVNIPLSSNSSSALTEIGSSIMGTLGGIGADENGAISIPLSPAISGIGDVLGAMNGEIDSTSSGGAITQHLNGYNLHQVFRNQCDIDYLNNGHPLSSNVQISSLSGYVLCKNGVLDINCMDSEKDKIKQYLISGFYYE